MALPRGIEHFSRFFQSFINDYVIIGGGAASVTLEDANLEFRVTKDIDVVLFTNGSKALNAKISEYISLGGYNINERTEEKPRYYRFSKPQNKEFPEIIEIFARVDSEIELRKGQYIIPIQNDSEAQLSAILLDNEYFELIKSNARKSLEGYSIIGPLANICLKARAYRELQDRHEEKKKIDKHRNDVVRLIPALTSDESLKIAGKPKEDVLKIISAIEEIDELSIKQLIGNILVKDEVLKILKEKFVHD